MKRFLGILLIFIFINIEVVWSQHAAPSQPGQQTPEEIKPEPDTSRLTPSTRAAPKSKIVITEEEAIKIIGEIPRPKALVALDRRKERPAGDTFAPDIEKLLDKSLEIEK